MKIAITVLVVYLIAGIYYVWRHMRLHVYKQPAYVRPAKGTI